LARAIRLQTAVSRPFPALRYIRHATDRACNRNRQPVELAHSSTASNCRDPSSPPQSGATTGIFSEPHCECNFQRPEEFDVNRLIATTLSLMIAVGASCAHAQDSMSKDEMKKDAMSKEGMTKDAMKKDAMSKEGMAKDGMKKDAMSKEGMAKDEMKKDASTKEGMAKDAMSKDGMAH
jgi:pentapeptide MXKDX repeat protein